MPQAKYQENPIDTLGARLNQAEAVLATFSGCYDPETKAFGVPAECMNLALWALQALLEQGHEAYEALLEEMDNARVVPLRGAVR